MFTGIVSVADPGPAALLMANVRHWMAAKHPDDLTLFIFEQGDVNQREIQRILEGARSISGEPAQMWPRQWRDERGRQRYLRPLAHIIHE